MKKKFKTTLNYTAFSIAIASSGMASAYEFDVENTKVSIYGYAKLDFIYDMDADLGKAVGNRNAIRLDGTKGSDGHTTVHAMQSRIGFSSLTPTDLGDIKTVIEGDFFANGGTSGNFRLRQAYGSWNGILAGQTWTNFGSLLAATPTVEFVPQPGQASGGRQPQLRYTTGGFSVALEDPKELGQQVLVPAGASGSAQHSLPDLTLRYQGAVGNLTYAGNALLREFSFYDDTTDDEESALGWGLIAEAKYQLTSGVVLRGSVTHGEGLGKYLAGNPATNPGYVNPVTGDVEAIEATGGSAGISVNVGPGSINLSYGIATADLDDAFNANAFDPMKADVLNKRHESANLNYIWSPIKHVVYGVEAAYHSREVYDGRDGDAVRLQGMVMYTF